jgi:hypothetical protein
MLKKMTVATALVLLVLAAGAFERARTQEGGAPPPKTEKVLAAYRLDFSINELEDGKKLNSRQYSMDLNSDSSNELKIGTRVPVESEPGKMQYIDVGTSIWSRLEDHSGQIDLSVRAEISNFAIPDQTQGHDPRPPVIRQFKINAGTLATLNKPMVIGSVDDPNSKRQFQLEVTVTKVR